MQVGDKVYLKAIGNNARHRENVYIKEQVIVKIGRKYFEVADSIDSNYTIKFNLENNRQVTNYSPDWALYFSKQEIYDEQELSKLKTEIRKCFDIFNQIELSLDQLRRIKAIIDEK